MIDTPIPIRVPFSSRSPSKPRNRNTPRSLRNGNGWSRRGSTVAIEGPNRDPRLRFYSSRLPEGAARLSLTPSSAPRARVASSSSSVSAGWSCSGSSSNCARKRLIRSQRKHTASSASGSRWRYGRTRVERIAGSAVARAFDPRSGPRPVERSNAQPYPPRPLDTRCRANPD